MRFRWGRSLSAFGVAVVSLGSSGTALGSVLDFNDSDLAIQVSSNGGPFDRIMPKKDGNSLTQSKGYLLKKAKNVGLFQILISDELSGGQPGRISQTTGSQVFMFFPRRVSPSGTKLANGDVRLVLPTGQVLWISGKTGRIQSIEGIGIQETPQATLASKGGLKIEKVSGAIVLEGGWRQGENPFAPRGQSQAGYPVFRDSKGHSCKVSRADILIWTRYDFSFKFKTDAELARFLSSRCPQLDLSVLTEPLPKKNGSALGERSSETTEKDFQERLRQISEKVEHQKKEESGAEDREAVRGAGLTEARGAE